MREISRRFQGKALACSPLNGEFWLNLALLHRSLGDDPAITARYLDLSRLFAPHEGLISERRARLF
jgi:hypothetical protein